MVKKTFKDNPALQFISTTEAEEIDITTPEDKPSIPMKPNPLYIETKSKRLQVLMQPSLYNKLKDIATGKDISLNQLINTALEKYTEEEGGK